MPGVAARARNWQGQAPRPPATPSLTHQARAVHNDRGYEWARADSELQDPDETGPSCRIRVATRIARVR